MTDEVRVSVLIRDASGAGPAATAAALEPWVVALLACPVDRGQLRVVKSELACDQCGRRYPALAGIPRIGPNDAAAEQKF